MVVEVQDIIGTRDYQTGDIEFCGSKGRKEHQKYVIVPPIEEKASDEMKSCLDHLYTLFMENWKMKTPNIIISVTGGAKNFSIRSSLKKEFQKSLCKAAIETGGWIISGGTHSGVMRYVGDAVHNHSAADLNKIIAVGIATLGTLEDREKFIKNDKPVILKSTDYKTLNENHSHFILVDDGKTNEYGGEITLRAKLERHIIEKIKVDYKKVVPIVCILLQGGPGSLKTVHQALENKTSVVVVGDSGGWANILATIYLESETYNSVNENLISGLLLDENMSYKAKELTEWTKMARDCIKHKKLIKIFCLRDHKSVADLDIAILEAILSANATSGVEDETLLEFAFAWNRCDIASSSILKDDIAIEPTILLELFMKALKQNKPAFVGLFLDHGIGFLSSVENKHFKDLYNHAKSKNRTLSELMKIHGDESDFKKFLEWMHLPSNVEGDPVNEQEILRRLFQWGVIVNRREIAQIIWNAMSEEEFPAAVVANRLLLRMAKKSDDQQMQQDYENHSEIYKKLSLGILTNCHEDDPKKTIISLTRKLKNWENVTCFEMAVKSKDYDFIAHQAVQSHLDKVWLGGITHYGKHSVWLVLYFWFRLIVCAWCPLFICCAGRFVKLQDDSANADSARSCCSTKKTSNGRRMNNQSEPVGQGTAAGMEMQPLNSPDASSENGGYVNEADVEKQCKCVTTVCNKTSADCCTKLKVFYNASVVKFFWNVFFYLVFLLLFAQFLLFNLYPHVHTVSCIPEYLLVCWVMILAGDEVRQIKNTKLKTKKRMLASWIGQLGNKMDLLSCVLFIVGYCCRFTHLHEARIFLALSFTVYSLRVLSLFKVNEDLGPKLMMVGKMLKDLYFFLFIWLVFLFAYGVASQSLLYPNETRMAVSLTSVFYKPYWQLYGELFLSEINYNPSANEITCTKNVTGNITNTESTRCPTESFVVPIMSAVYMILVNVLLLNLLIAMFSYSFDNLVKKTGNIWRFQRFALIKEYYYRPWMVVPFTFFYFFYYLYKYCKGNNESDTKKRRDEFEKELDKEACSDHDSWEHLRTEAYLEEQRIAKSDETSTRLENHSNALDSIKKHQKMFLKRLALPSPKTAHKPVHIKARTPLYPETEIKRAPVEDHMVSWNVPFDDYNPLVCDEINENLGKEKADPRNNEKLPPYNEYDLDMSIDRTSYLGRYMVVDDVPRNPIGRTGLKGRGKLGRYGPNHIAYWIVTRWKKCKKKEGKRVLEFVALKRQDTDMWAIPGGMVLAEKNVSETWAREFILKLLDPTGKANNEFLTFAGTEVHRGYSDDHRNTDNAWIEALVSNFHDERGSFLSDEKVQQAKGVRWENGNNEKGKRKLTEEIVKWIEIGEEGVDLFADHEEFVKMVAEMRNAFY